MKYRISLYSLDRDGKLEDCYILAFKEYEIGENWLKYFSEETGGDSPIWLSIRDVFRIQVDAVKEE